MHTYGCKITKNILIMCMKTRKGVQKLKIYQKKDSRGEA